MSAIEIEGNQLKVTVPELVFEDLGTLGVKLGLLLERPEPELVLDLAQVIYLPSSILGSILHFSGQARTRNKKVRVRLRDALRKNLEQLHVATGMDFDEIQG